MIFLGKGNIMLSFDLLKEVFFENKVIVFFS